MNNATQFMKNPHLPGGDFFWEGNETGFLMIHGFTATTAEVRPMAEMLHEAGYTVMAPLLPGHGTHPDELNHATWEMWLEAVKQAYEKTLCDCQKVYVLGESMGALLALALAAQHPEIPAVIVFAPAIKVKKLWLSRLMAPFKEYIEKSGEDDGLPWKGYTVYPVSAAVELLKLQKHTRKVLDKIHQPLLIFTGEYDTTLAPKAAEIVLKGVKSERKQHLHMMQSPHCILLDKELEKAFQDLIDFITG
jgi:carboxylesterase